jgi:hypothetical protein
VQAAHPGPCNPGFTTKQRRRYAAQGVFKAKLACLVAVAAEGQTATDLTGEGECPEVKCLALGLNGQNSYWMPAIQIFKRQKPTAEFGYGGPI